MGWGVRSSVRIASNENRHKGKNYYAPIVSFIVGGIGLIGSERASRSSDFEEWRSESPGP